MLFRSSRRLWGDYKALPSNVWMLSLVSFLNDVSSEIIYPILPAFLALSLGATPLIVGVIEGLAESIASLLKLFSGYLSDKFQKRKLPVMAGYIIAGLARPILAFVTTWPQVLVVRAIDRTGKGIRGAPRDALLAADVPREKRGLAFGFNRAADHLGAVFGPIVGFILIWFIAVNPKAPSIAEYQNVFLFASVPLILGLLIVAFFVHEKPRAANNQTNGEVTLSLAQFDGNFKRFLVVIALFTLSNSTDAFLLLRASDAGVSPAVLPLLWVTLHASKVVSSVIGGDLSDKFGRKKLIFAGWIVYAMVYLGFAFVSAAWHVWALFIIYGAYFGLTEGAEKALVADLVPEEKRGTAFGLYNLAFGITVFPASLLLGAIWNVYGASAAFIFSSALSIFAAISLLSINTKPHDLNSDAPSA